MDPVTLKMAANLGLSLAKSKTVHRLLIIAALIQAVVWSFVLFVPAYLMASVAPSMHQVATEQACTAGTGADSSVPLPAGAAGAQLTVRMATWNVLKSNSANRIVGGLTSIAAAGADVIGVQELQVEPPQHGRAADAAGRMGHVRRQHRHSRVLASQQVPAAGAGP